MRERLAETKDHVVEDHKKTLGLLAQYLWQKNQNSTKLRIICSVLCLILAKVASVWVPVFYRDMVNHLNQINQSQSIMVGLILAYGLTKFMQTLFSELRDLIFIKVSQRSRRSVALKTFKHLHNLSLRFHLNRQTGGLSRVIERGTSGIHSILYFMLFNIVPTFLELSFIAILFFFYFGPLYSFVILVTVLTYMGSTLIITEWRIKFRRSMNRTDEQANSKAIDSLINFETVKYFNNEDFEYQRFDQSLLNYEKAALKSQSSLTLLNASQNLIIVTGTVSLLYLAYSDMVANKINIGEFVMINTYMMQLFLPLNFLGFVYRQLKQSLVDVDKMFKLMDEDSEVKDIKNATHLTPGPGAVRFESVSFSYHKERPIIKNLSLTIPPGQTVAIVGESGSGKSTLIRLLYRFYNVDQGRILIDGQDINLVSQSSLRKSIGIVPQDTVLFNESISYNIKYGNPEADESKMLEACQLAQLERLIDHSPQGLETIVGERGLKVSGGEKQRIAIARTIMKDPSILVLDEATSALDTKTEKEIEAAIEQVSKNRTTIIIAHRLSTIIHADLIVCLKKGELVESGSHQELLQQRGEYYSMWQRQKEIDIYQTKLQEISSDTP